MIERWRWLRKTDPRQFEETVRSLPREAQQLLRDLWITQARDEQLPPPGDWRLWLICAGRGFGKTRTGAEWVTEVARSNRHARIALVGSSLTEVRAVMVEGESGLLACSLGDNRPRFDPSLRRVVWPGGAQAFLFSAAEPDSLRGPQHSHACRPDPERSLRQRGLLPCRYAVASGRREHCRNPADDALGGRLLAGGQQPLGGLG